MKPKKLPRLWCALQGLLPFEACLDAQRGELGWPPERETESARSEGDEQPGKTRKGVAGPRTTVNVRRRASV